MGVRIDGEWHEELADPGTGGTDSGNGRNFDSGAEYNQASQQVASSGGWGENLNTTYGSGAGGTAGGAGAQQYGDAIQKALDALASGNREAFQRAMYEFDVAFQLDKDKFGEDIRRFNQTFEVTQAGLTGNYQGAPTLPALTSYANQFGQWGVPTQGAPTLEMQALYGGYGAPAAGQQTLAAQNQNATLYGYNPGANAVGPNGQPLQTLAAQNQYFTQGLAGITTAAGLQANPFRQQQVLGQLGGLYGGQGVAGFQAPNTVAGVGTAGGNNRGGMGYLQQMIDDIRDPTPNQTNMNQVLDATPTPNKLNSVDFLRAAPSTQSMVLQAMQEKYGLDPNDSIKQIQNTLPQFQAPSAMGGIRR